MTNTPIDNILDKCPDALRPLLSGARLVDSSCSPEAQVIFIDKDAGYFLKLAPKGNLEREALMTRYFHRKGLSPSVLSYISREQDWLVTAKVRGDDCRRQRYLEQPEKLCDILAEQLVMLHNVDFTDCPQKHTQPYLEKMRQNKHAESYDKSHFPNSFGYVSAAEAWAVVESQGNLLKTDTLLHGDYCLPNIILEDWRFSGFIDLDNSGIGDRHVDIFWGIWSLGFNLKTDKYRSRFMDAYGRHRIDEDMLRVVAAIEVFG